MLRQRHGVRQHRQTAADLLAFDGATVVDGVSGVIRAIRFKIQPSAGGCQRYKLDKHGTKHNSCLYASSIAPYVAIVRSDDGHITVFTPAASARGECFRCDPEAIRSKS